VGCYACCETVYEFQYRLGLFRQGIVLNMTYFMVFVLFRLFHHILISELYSYIHKFPIKAYVICPIMYNNKKLVVRVIFEYREHAIAYCFCTYINIYFLLIIKSISVFNL